MKKSKTLFVALLLAMLCMLLPLNAMAATTTQYGLEVELTTDRQSYEAGETILATLTVKNLLDIDLKDVSLEIVVPEGCVLSSGSENILITDIKAGETISFEANYIANGTIVLPSTGDNSNLVIWGIMLVIACGMLFVLTAKKARAMLSLLLCVAIFSSCFVGWPTIVSAESRDDVANEIRTITVKENIEVDGNHAEVKGIVTFGTGSVTREEWITALVNVMGYSIITDGQYSFDDWYDANNPAVVETAIRHGLLNLEPDEDNIVHFAPQNGATRDFLAYTSNRALMFSDAKTDTPNWSDYNSVPHKEDARMAIDFGLLSLIDNAFMPSSFISNTDQEQAIRAIVDVLSSTSVPQTPIGHIEYADGVEETFLWFSVDEANRVVTVYEPELVKDWRVGQVHALRSTNPMVADLAIKITGIKRNGPVVLINYNAPQFNEVVKSVSLTGTTTEGIYLTPAPGVVFDNGSMSRGRATVADTIDISKPHSFDITLGEVDFSGSFSIDSIEYRFSASSNWRFPFVSIDEAYAAVNSSIELSASTALIQAPEEDIFEIPLGELNIPLGYGFNLEGELEFCLEVDDISLEVSWGCKFKNGVQYTSSNWIRPISDINADPLVPKIGGEAKLMLEIELEAQFLSTFQITEVGAETGATFEGSITGYPNPSIFCVDGGAFFFFTLYAEIGPEALDLRFNREVINRDNSPWKKEFHVEETGLKAECTRGDGDYEGYVKDSSTNQPVYRAKIEIYKGLTRKDLTYTDSNGKFKGISLPHGQYKLRVSAGGYVPYEKNITIVGGNTTQVSALLMLGREEENSAQSRTISGRVTDGTTGNGLANARVSFHDASLAGVGDVAATTVTNSSGNYSVSLPVGVYEIIVSKNDYVPAGRTITLLNNQSNVNFSLSPENLSDESNNLRAILHWGATPSDLDSHLTGPTGHVYYNNMSISNANLDVDDVTSYGPETITISESDSGVYSYYIHDYTNRDSGASQAISNSGAYIELYNGSTYLYTINVPENRSGTLWHVFNFYPETMEIELINSFSYQSSPSAVGSRARSIGNPADDIKTYTEDKRN